MPPGVRAVRYPLPGRALYGAAAVAGRPRLDRAARRRLRRRLGTCPCTSGGRRDARSCSRSTTARGRRDRRTSRRYERLWHRAARPRRLARRAARVLCVTRHRAARADRGVAARPGARADRPARPPVARQRGAGPAGSRRTSSSSARSSRARRRRCSSRPSATPASEDSRRSSSSPERDGSRSTAPGVRRLGRVDDLGALYAGALAVVLPSWLEGFGLPPVEGIAAGTPAIVSDLPVLREVLGEGALFVPPGRRRGARRGTAPRRGRSGAARASPDRGPRGDRARSAGPRPHGARGRCWRRRRAR